MLDGAMDREIDHRGSALAKLGGELVDALQERGRDLEADELFDLAPGAGRLRCRCVRCPADESLSRCVICSSRRMPRVLATNTSLSNS